MVFVLTVTPRRKRRQGWKAHFRPLQRQADFHPEIRIARLPNRTTDKLKGWRFFSWHSIEDSFKIQAPPSNFREMQLSKRPASAAGISCAKEQPSRCLLHTDWMVLNNALLQKPLVGEETETYSERRFIYWSRWSTEVNRRADVSRILKDGIFSIGPLSIHHDYHLDLKIRDHIYIPVSRKQAISITKWKPFTCVSHVKGARARNGRQFPI